MSGQIITIGNVTLYHGDNREILPTLAPVDAIVTDPPYGLNFMGNHWDYDVPDADAWRACLRVLKPGGHLLAFAGTRTQHRMACAIEDAGFDIRDMIAWIYGSGFPKAMDVSKAIDKAAGAERAFVPAGNAVKRMIPGADQDATGSWIKDNGRLFQPGTSEPATEPARQWQGWGTALKPALEPITFARKPLIGTVAQNVLTHGTGAVNIGACRVPGTVTTNPLVRNAGSAVYGRHLHRGGEESNTSEGRFPANVIHDGSEEVMERFPQSSSGGYPPEGSQRPGGHVYGRPTARGEQKFTHSNGSAARFFYTAKASRKERGEGNTHPTVKPTALMAYLCRLVTQPGGLVLDPYLGSGTTALAATREGFKFIGIEREKKYFDIAVARVQKQAEELAQQLPLK